MRALKILVSVMGVLIVLATVGLVVAIVQRMNKASTASGVPAVSTDLALRQPAGSRINQIATVEGRLALWVTRPDGDRILLLDGAGRLAGEIRLGE